MFQHMACTGQETAGRACLFLQATFATTPQNHLQSSGKVLVIWPPL